MSKEIPESINFHLEGGTAAEHPKQADFPILVGPSIGDEFNTVVQALRVSACWCVDDMRFAFDSSFVAPEIAKELGALEALVEKFPDDLLSVFAHADPVGNDEYNKQLSGRRAMAIYALLTRRVEMWEDIYDHPLVGDVWGEPALNTMAKTVAASADPNDGGGDPPAPPTNDSDDLGPGCPLFVLEGLAPDSPDADAAATPAKTQLEPAKRAKACAHDRVQRRKLFRDYMDTLCGPDLELQKEDFLGRGADPGGKADFQGCSEFNPVLIFSQQEAQHFAPVARHEERNEENAPNRRVLIFFFKNGADLDPSRWPCPRAKEGTAGCRLRFWSDHKKRLANQPEHREYPQTRDTFGCRFYDRLARASPCETIALPLRFRLYNPDGHFIPDAAWRLHMDGQEPRDGVASPRGFVAIRRVPGLSSGRIAWGAAGTEDETPDLAFEDAIFLNIDGDPATQAERRLINLGYGGGSPLSGMVRAFQTDYQESQGLAVNGILDEPTQAAIRDVHDGMADRLREQ